ncbi:two-component regulator propeller domain-containing protein [Silvibacterium sp.]|uniref:sensor histidine kinase n=1 Tax=Silvibacterium sp. TaxID=1964179 RepID=UPI0039E59FEC
MRVARWLQMAIPVLCMWLLPPARGFADEGAQHGSDYVETAFTIENGLPDDTINAITQTKSGILWVGTGGGLASFDGRTFTHVELRVHGGVPLTSVTALVEGDDGDLWVGSDAGIVRIRRDELTDPEIGASASYRLGRGQSDEILSIFKRSNGEIWAGTNHALYRFDGHQFVIAATSIYVSRIKESHNGHLLLITGNGAEEYDGSPNLKSLHAGESVGVKDNQIFDIFEDAEGRRWYCTEKGVFAPGERKFHHLLPEGPGTTATFREATDSHGTPWVATGIGLYAIVNGRLEGPSDKPTPRSFYVSRSGDLWIGTNGQGLFHLQRRAVQMYTAADGLLNDAVMAVLAAKNGDLWVGNNCGLERFDGWRFQRFAEKDGLKNSCVWSLAEDQERNIWIGTYGGGAFRYRDGSFRQFTMEQGLGSRIVFRILPGRDGSLWFATPDGLSRMAGGSFRNYTIADGLSSNQVFDVHEDRQGTIWAATRGGVDRLEGDRFVSVPVYSHDETVLALRFFEDSSGHLYTTDLPNGTSRFVDNRLVHESNSVYLMNMVQGSDHSLWFSSHSGIIHMQEGDLAARHDADLPPNFQQFGTHDGLNSIQAGAGQPNIAATADGRIWTATVRGLAMIDTAALPHVSSAPEIFVSRASIDGVRSKIGDRLVLRPGIHHLEMTLAAVDLAAPEKIRLQYRMEGVDAGWLNADDSRSIVYTNIPAGSHPLYVRATDNAGNWSQSRAIYEVTQQPYFYQSRVVQLGALAAAFLLLVSTYQLRMRHVLSQSSRILRARQIERETIARDLHDTFLQGVQGLVLHFNAGTRQLPPGEPVRTMFEEALRQSDRVLLEGRGLLLRLTSEKVSSQSLAEGFTEVGRALENLSDAEFSVRMHGGEREINRVVHEELFQLGREAIFNAFRHARAKQIAVVLNFGVSGLQLQVTDDGVGIDPVVLESGAAPGHLGLLGIRSRAERAGGSVEIHSRRGAGTEISVRVPREIAYREEMAHRVPGSAALGHVALGHVALRWVGSLLSRLRFRFRSGAGRDGRVRT